MKTLMAPQNWNVARIMAWACAAVVTCGLVPAALGAPSLTAWQPLFKGIDLARGTNTVSSGDFNNRMVMHALRVDLTDPDVRLVPSPRITSYVSGLRETAGMTVSRFVETRGVQVAVNANFFDPTAYYLPEGTPMIVSGLHVSGGQVVSSGNLDHAASLLFDAANRPTVASAAATAMIKSRSSGLLVRDAATASPAAHSHQAPGCSMRAVTFACAWPGPRRRPR